MMMALKRTMTMMTIFMRMMTIAPRQSVPAILSSGSYLWPTGVTYNHHHWHHDQHHHWHHLQSSVEHVCHTGPEHKDWVHWGGDAAHNDDDDDSDDDDVGCDNNKLEFRFSPYIAQDVGPTSSWMPFSLFTLSLKNLTDINYPDLPGISSKTQTLWKNACNCFRRWTDAATALNVVFQFYQKRGAVPNSDECF